jgi:regulator of replication initiation timing
MNNDSESASMNNQQCNDLNRIPVNKNDFEEANEIQLLKKQLEKSKEENDALKKENSELKKRYEKVEQENK